MSHDCLSLVNEDLEFRHKSR